MLKAIISIFVIFLLIFDVTAKPASSRQVFDHTHKNFDAILKKYVTFQGKQSLVAYHKLVNEQEALGHYLKSLSNVKKKEFDKFSENRKLAFLINAYNAFTLKIILNHYPLKSIKDIGSFFSNAWKKDFFTLFGKKTHLDFLEHKMIRKWFQEPRIHFAVNCASLGCPSLRRDAFIGEKLNEQLEEAMIHFLSNVEKNKVKEGQKKIYLSKIFDWYEDDFAKAKGSLLHYLGPYFKYMTSDEKVMMAIKKGKYRIRYLSYDWDLNGVKSGKK